MIALGADYWQKIKAEADSRHFLTYNEKTQLEKMITMAKTCVIPYSQSGKLPRITVEIMNTAKSVVKKLEMEGIQI